MDRLASRLRKLRKDKDLTQGELASKSKLHVRVVQEVESGTSNPKYETLKLLASGLGVPLADLVDEESDRLDAKASASFSAAFLEAFAQRSPTLQRFVLSLVFLDPSYLEKIDEHHQLEKLVSRLRAL